MHGNLQRNLNCEEFGYVKSLPIWYHAEKNEKPPRLFE